MLVFKIERRHALSLRRYTIDTSSAPSRRAAFAASIAVLPAPITTTFPATLAIFAVLYAAINSSASTTPRVIFARNLQPLHRSQAHAKKNQIKLLLDLRQRLCVDLRTEAKLDAQLFDQLNLAQARPRRQLVLSHAVGIQPTRQRPPLEHRHRKSLLRQLCGARQRCRARADARDFAFTSSLQISSAAFRRAHETHPSQTAAAARSQSAARCSWCITHAPSHSTSTGHTREQLAPSTFASRIVRADPRRFPLAIFLMNPGTSMCVGHAAVHGASKQFRQRLASTTAACGANGGCRS